VADFFLDGGVVVTTKSRIPGENAVFSAKARTFVPADMPVIVLINRGSASASEIVAGALKDRGRAYLVGEKSFGKGSVQQVYPIDDSGFKITTSRYYTPSDVNIDKIGIPPDLEVKFPNSPMPRRRPSNTGSSPTRRSPSSWSPTRRLDPARVASYAKELGAAYGLEDSLLRRMIRDEQNRTSAAPVYDLEYDVQLKAALDILRENKYDQLMRNVKNLKDLQEAAKAETAAADAEKQPRF
jgi:carboxyl-terminal processing protease